MSTTDRPAMADGYGLLPANEGKGLLPWAWATERLEQSRNYWIASTRPDGRPHVIPVWGIWLDDALYFGTDPASVKGRNLQANPAIAVHLESGDEVVILEGQAEIVSDRPLLAQVYQRYGAKYDIKLGPESPDSPEEYPYTLRLRPQRALAWLETDFPGTATRWRFDGYQPGKR